MEENPSRPALGIDWADTKHDICLQAGDENHCQFDCIPHQADRIDEWAKALHLRFDGPIAVALELAKGPIVSALLKYDFFVLFPINPSTLAKYRVAFKPSCAKDDPTEAELALDLLLRHPQRFTALSPCRPKHPIQANSAMQRLLSIEPPIAFR
ncbi:transposase [Pseudomonas sp. NA-150]|uniref:IS110 family transposase n=1 Tax=Pseudomonas sp. NA-150 TaxID=3367525 RepID=UPI0037CB3164